jgi:hypothetical protein
VSATPLNQAYGPCTLYANPFTGLVLKGPLVLQETTMVIPLTATPSLAGVEFQFQHLVLPNLTIPACNTDLVPGLGIKFCMSEPRIGTFE